MGEYTEMILEGVLCEECGELIGDGVGYPRKCNGCGGARKAQSKPKQKQARKDRPKGRDQRRAMKGAK